MTQAKAAHIASSADSLLRQGRLAEALAVLRAALGDEPLLAPLLAQWLLLFDAGEAAEQEAVAVLLAAESDAPDAAALLASLALGGRLQPFDERAIAARLERAAAAGNVPALRALALAAARHDGEAARALWWRACRLGDPVAALLLAARLRDGEGSADERAQSALLEQRLAQAGLAPLPGIVPAPTSPAGAWESIDLAAWLRLPTARELHGQPRVAVHDGFFTTDECRFVIAMGRPLLKRSQVYDESSGRSGALPIRSSSDASFDLMHEDFSLRLLQQRMARAAGLDVRHGEPLILLHYRPGEEYRPHRDYLAPSALAGFQPAAGQRSRTVCVYLNDVVEGGSTSFPELGIDVPARAGAALVFDNTRSDGGLEPRSLHAGTPIRAGEKWLATLWLRERPLRPW